MAESWSEHDLTTLAALDHELPHADPHLLALQERLRALVNDDDTLAQIEHGLQAALRAFGNRWSNDLTADIQRLFQLVRNNFPTGTSPAVQDAVYELLARMFEVGANITAGGDPLPPKS